MEKVGIFLQVNSLCSLKIAALKRKEGETENGEALQRE